MPIAQRKTSPTLLQTDHSREGPSSMFEEPSGASSNSTGNRKTGELSPNNQKLWGAIIISLIGEVRTTSQISYHIGFRIEQVRREIILLNHFGIIEPIGIRTTEDSEPTGGYYSDLLWELTEHAMRHSNPWDGCRACNLRELLVMSRPPTRTTTRRPYDKQ